MRHTFLIFPILVATLSGAAEGRTESALTAANLMGKWCTDVATYTFASDKLVVTFPKGQPRVMRIEKIDVGGDWINVVWDKRDGGNTVFSKFSGDYMKQNANDKGDRGPERFFHRC